MRKFSIGAVLLNLSVTFCAKFPENFCPYFIYLSSRNGSIYGRLTLPYDGSDGLNLNVQASFSGIYVPIPKLTVVLASPTVDFRQNIQYFVYFPFWDNIPKITSVQLNGKTYCSSPAVPEDKRGFTIIWAQHLQKIPQADTESTSRFARPVYLQSAQQPVQGIFTTTALFLSCGTANESPLVVEGSKELPWLAALFQYDEAGQAVYRCAANLISTRHFVTAAHCVINSKPDRFAIEVGSSIVQVDFQTWKNPRTLADVKISPYYTRGPFGDVAVLTTTRPVVLSENVRPICLWSGHRNVVDIVGIVAGWETDTHEGNGARVMKATNGRIVSPIRCIDDYGYRNVYELFLQYCFCLGQTSLTICQSDSGAGFMIKENGRYWLRGVVSAGQICEPFSYTVFADITAHLNWILSVVLAL